MLLAVLKLLIPAIVILLAIALVLHSKDDVELNLDSTKGTLKLKKKSPAKPKPASKPKTQNKRSPRKKRTT